MKNFKATKPIAMFLVLALCLCVSFSFARTESRFTPLGTATADIDTEAIQNNTSDEIETGIPFLVAMIILGGGISAILGAIQIKRS